MKSFAMPKTHAQNEALLNEFKGNLFEYLIGQELARHFEIEENFIRGFAGEIKQQLMSYEAWIRLHDPLLLKRLPVLARESCKQLLTYLPAKIDQIAVVGKYAVDHEADLLISAGPQTIPISIKLCKEKAFVNTKSGGIKSFLARYFSAFEDISALQHQLNQVVQQGFYRMGYELYQLKGLEFGGSFDDNWVGNGYPELPGQLDQQMSEIVLANYYQVISCLHQIFGKLWERDEERFRQCLPALIGQKGGDIIQLSCFYRSDYQLGEVRLIDQHSTGCLLEEVAIMPLKKGLSSFEIHLRKLVLQVRIKPMNKFTVPGLKVNCSIR